MCERTHNEAHKLIEIHKDDNLLEYNNKDKSNNSSFI